ncbi:MAG: SOS response-associated peptidase [Candidatus Cloacimonetes bacterium]|nr:SOS response-associated peptidase [Candidatus Cloacimonadota bacterium]
MCGRFALYSSVQAIMEYSKILETTHKFRSSYNITPGQNIPAVIRSQNTDILADFHWGLIPFWAPDTKIGSKMINARAETINERPSFRNAFLKRRCLIPANGFYEWRRQDKQPYYIRIENRNIFMFAGIWEQWRDKTGHNIDSCCIITTLPNAVMENIHNRMPVILPREYEQHWLNDQDAENLRKLLQPYPGNMTACPVTRAVNSPANDGPELIEAINI